MYSVLEQSWDKALEYYSRDLAICEKILGQEHPSTATSYGNIGAVYYNLGDYDKALEYYSKALAIYEKKLGKENPDTKSLYNCIADLTERIGNNNN